MEGDDTSESHTYERIYVNGYHGHSKQHVCAEDNPTCQVILSVSIISALFCELY